MQSRNRWECKAIPNRQSSPKENANGNCGNASRTIWGSFCLQSLVQYFKSNNWNFLVVLLEGKQQITPEFEKKFQVLKTSTDVVKNFEPEEQKKGDESGRETKWLDLRIPNGAQVLDNAFCNDFHVVQ